MNDYGHISVLADEVLHYLAPRTGGLYCDGTLGAGGHTEKILEASSPDGRVIGIDKDPDAIAIARERLSRFGDRLTIVHGAFGDVAAILARLGIDAVDGIVLDLGVSSMQLDRAPRGFSFSSEGPLDMRMDPTGGETALALIKRISVDELKELIGRYGEERYAGRVARAVWEGVRQGHIRTTTELAAIVTRAVPKPGPKDKIHPATRTFQALRIAVNHELDELEQLLRDFPPLLRMAGRLVVISFHSLEDRLVKQRIRELEWTSRLPPDLAAKAGERTQPVCTSLTSQPVTASEDEMAKNPRSRSAKLRACERTGPVTAASAESQKHARGARRR